VKPTRYISGFEGSLR